MPCLLQLIHFQTAGTAKHVTELASTLCPNKANGFPLPPYSWGPGWRHGCRSLPSDTHTMAVRQTLRSSGQSQASLQVPLYDKYTNCPWLRYALLFSVAMVPATSLCVLASVCAHSTNELIQTVSGPLKIEISSTHLTGR